jgi:hypothetical protein
MRQVGTITGSSAWLDLEENPALNAPRAFAAIRSPVEGGVGKFVERLRT